MDHEPAVAMRADLRRLVEGLTLQDKVDLWGHLSADLMSARRMTKSPSRGAELLGEMAAVMGGDEISIKSREASQVWARTMVAYQMLLEGYTTVEVGEQLRKKHSSVIHMRTKMEDAISMPQFFGDVLEVWQKFQRRIYDIHQGTDSDSFCVGGELPHSRPCAVGEESRKDRPAHDP